MENIVRKGEVACNKQFILFSQCFLPYMVLIFHFKCTLKCRLQFVSIWTTLKFCHLVMGQLFSELKAFTGDEFTLYSIDTRFNTSTTAFENTVGKGEIACYDVFYSIR